MSKIISYDIWTFTFVCLCTDNSYDNWFVYIELYYLQLVTIIAYHLNVHIMPLRYVICNHIWHMESQNYELICLIVYSKTDFSVKLWHFSFIIKEHVLIHEANPQYHYFRMCCPSVRPYPLFKISQNKTKFKQE